MTFFKKSTLFLLIAVIGMISSCQHDIDMYVPTSSTTGYIVNPSPVQASVQGKVVDDNNNPVAGATVKASGNITTTDAGGIFRFSHIQLDKYASVVTVESNGFFKGIRTFSAKEGSSNFVRLKLIPKVLVGSVDAATGGAVSLSENSQVTLLANSVIVKSTGAAYTGPVRIYAAKIDPTASDITEKIPGSFQATDENNFRVTLKSFGMLAVLLEGSSGEALQIATGKTAKLNVTIPASLSSSAPSTLPLWYLNETDGLWKQEGSATKTGNQYIGDVSHFSFWNCDASANTVYFEVNVYTANGPLPNAMVKLTRINNGGFSYGITDTLGHVGGMIFSNEQLQLDVVNECHEVIYTQNIGPYTQNTNLGTITVTVSPQNALQVIGNVVDCSQQLVNNGTAMIFVDGYPYLAPIANGHYNLNVLRCSNSSGSVQVVAVDNSTNQQSTPWSGTATTNTITVDTLSACSTVTTSNEFITYMINGINISFTPPNASFFHNGSPTSNAIVSALNSTGGGNCNMSFTNDSISVNHIQQLISFQSNSTALVPVGNVGVTISEYGPVGGYIAGSFSGGFATQPQSTGYQVTCSFRVKRAY